MVWNGSKIGRHNVISRITGAAPQPLFPTISLVCSPFGNQLATKKAQNSKRIKLNCILSGHNNDLAQTYFYILGLIGGTQLSINLRPFFGDCHGVGHKYSSGHDGHRHGIGRGFAFSPGIVVMVMVLVMNKVEATTSGNKEMTLGYHVKLLSLV